MKYFVRELYDASKQLKYEGVIFHTGFYWQFCTWIAPVGRM